jgi:hypothetical protein
MMCADMLKDIRLKRVLSDKYATKEIQKDDVTSVVVGGCDGG